MFALERFSNAGIFFFISIQLLNSNGLSLGKQSNQYVLHCFRLLNLDVDLWVHLNCALWSLEVYETLNGALMNVEAAVKRGITTVSPGNQYLRME